jgi:hypothetical protein
MSMYIHVNKKSDVMEEISFIYNNEIIFSLLILHTKSNWN